MKVSITSLTHDELVSLFSTATYGCPWLSFTTRDDLGAVVPPIIIEKQAEFADRGEMYCREDKWADILLNGGTILAIDYNDEDEEGEEGKLYPITLKNVLDGLAKAFTECPKNVCEVIKFDGSDDYYDANNVMQCVLFGEVVYG